MRNARDERAILDTEAIAATFEGFRAERAPAVEEVRGWVAAVVHGGAWRFGDAEGVVQEILVKLVGIVRAGKVREAGGFRKFVTTVSRHTCVTLYHRERRREDVEGAEVPPEKAHAGPGPQHDMERRERADLAVWILQQLPGQCDALWRAIYAERKSQQEVAERFGITVNNLRVRVHRCLDRARQLFRDYEAHGAAGAAAASGEARPCPDAKP